MIRSSFLFLAVMFATSIFANSNSKATKTDSAPDVSGTSVKPALYPDLNRLFFNQDYVFELRGCEDCKITRVVFEDGSVSIDGNKVYLTVHYANFSSLKSGFKVFVKDGKGRVSLFTDKEVAITQKYLYEEDEEFEDNNLFRLDGRIINIDETMSREVLSGFKCFSMNEPRFERPDFRMTGFDMTVFSNGKSTTYKAIGSEITEEMKAAINSLGINDRVEFSNIRSVYMDNGHLAPLSTNYTVKITIGTEG